MTKKTEEGFWQREKRGIKSAAIDLLGNVMLMAYWGVILAAIAYYIVMTGMAIWTYPSWTTAAMTESNEMFRNIVSASILVLGAGVAVPAIIAQGIAGVLLWFLVAEDRRARIQREISLSILLLMLIVTAYAWMSWGMSLFQ